MSNDGASDTIDATDDANFAHRPVSRRLLIGGSAAFGAGLTAFGAGAMPAVASPGGSGPGWNGQPVRAAIRFLKGVANAHHTSGPRLAQSYQDNSGLSDIGFVYDNALAIIALLAAGEGATARAIGDALLYAQQHDLEFTDGRLRQAYHTNGFIADGKAQHGGDFGLAGTAVGDMAWAGIALAQLARATGIARYRDGAVAIATWIQTNTFSKLRFGGYTFGETSGLTKRKSSEHNIDVAAFFRLLHTLTGERRWRDGAEHAWSFVERMWNADGGYFWTGTLDDDVEINKLGSQLPLDVQTWSWLARRRRAYAEALDWAASNLATTDTPQRLNSSLTGNQTVTGVAFASGSLQADPTVPIDQWNPKPDSGGVWFEGASQLALSLANRNRAGDKVAAQRLLDAVIWAQDELGSTQTFGGRRIDGGIVAASSPMHTGFGFGYYPNLHVGATSWFVFADSGVNPYVF